jgi:beta-glucuronidase
MKQFQARKAFRLFAWIVVLAPSLVCSAATRIDMDQSWRFRIDSQKTGESSGWMNTIPDQTESVSLPNTWNIGKNSRYEGTAWYFKTFPADASLRGRHVEIHFGATFYKARVFLNGALLGEHEGGYSAYYFDITSHLRPMNMLAVELNNEPGPETIPGAPLKDDPTGHIYDWWPYGGIVRDAWLTVNDPMLIRWQHIDTAVSGANAEVSDRVRIENHGRRAETLILTTQIFPQNGGPPVASVTKTVSIEPGVQEPVVALTLANPHRWSLDNPYLYSVETQVTRKDGVYVDSVSDNIGARTIEIHDRGLYINGQRVRLSGLARHEDSPWEGLAETSGTMLYDYNDLKNLQTTLTRPVHYQQNPFIYAYADRNGILMIPEIPMWQFGEKQMTNPKVIALAKQEFTELVEQNYNHPCIFAWSTDNESATDTPGGIAYFKTMYALAKKLDPHRYVSYADDRIAFVKNPKDNASSLADFVMWNEYFGTWDAPESLLPATIERLGKDYPDKMFIISEFGTPGIYATDPAAADRLRIQTMREQMKLFSQTDWIAGAILWCYQDYHSYHNLRPDQYERYVDHGVVTQDRQRKPSYYVWQELNSPAEIQAAWTLDSAGQPTGFAATIARRPLTDLPSYPLSGYRLEWRVIDEAAEPFQSSEQWLGAMGDPQKITAQWGTPGKHTYLRLELRLYRETGFLVLEKKLTWRMPERGDDDGRDSTGN